MSAYTMDIECAMDADLAFISDPRSRAVGREAKEIQRQEIGIEREILQAPGSGARQRAAIFSILNAVHEQGEKEAPASFASARYAIAMLKDLLLIAQELPHVSVDPDGEISLEWYRAPRLVFSVSVGPQGELTYAGLFGRSKVHGLEIHTVDGIPREIRAGIQRVYA